MNDQQKKLAPLNTRVSLYKIEVFKAVVDLGSVGDAAENFGITQPVVTSHLRSLELRVGEKLFHKQGRRLALTPAGKAVYSWATDLVTRTSELSRQLEGVIDGTRGNVSIASSVSAGSYILPGMVAEFGMRNPNITLSLNVSDADRALSAVERGQCDFAVVFADHPPAIPTLVGERIGDEPLVVVASRSGEPLSNSIDLTELAALDFVELPEGSPRRSLHEAHLAEAGILDRRIAMEMGNPEAIKRSVEQGAGVALLFRSSISAELALGTLRVITVGGWDARVAIYVVHRKNHHFSAAQRAVYDALVVRIGQRTAR